MTWNRSPAGLKPRMLWDQKVQGLQCLASLTSPDSDDLLSQRALASSVPSTQPVSSATLESQAAPLCLPIQIMLLPLSKRFRYHFYGNRQTNSLSKVSHTHTEHAYKHMY